MMSATMAVVERAGSNAAGRGFAGVWRGAPWATFLLTAAALAVYAVPGCAPVLGYERASMGQIWRVATCHWAHWNGEHLLWSVGTFAVLGALCERENRRAFFACVGGAVVAIPLILWAAAPGLDTYGGLSGLDSALFVLLAIGILRQKARGCEWGWVAGGGVLLLAFFAKIGFEFAAGTPVFVSEDVAMNPVPLAHLVGGVVGAVGLGRSRSPELIHQVHEGPRRRN